MWQGVPVSFAFSETFLYVGGRALYLQRNPTRSICFLNFPRRASCRGPLHVAVCPGARAEGVYIALHVTRDPQSRDAVATVCPGVFRRIRAQLPSMSRTSIPTVLLAPTDASHACTSTHSLKHVHHVSMPPRLSAWSSATGADAWACPSPPQS